MLSANGSLVSLAVYSNLFTSAVSTESMRLPCIAQRVSRSVYLDIFISSLFYFAQVVDVQIHIAPFIQKPCCACIWYGYHLTVAQAHGWLQRSKCFGSTSHVFACD